MSRFKAVLFDYDDTLANTYSARVKAAKKGAEGRLSSDLDMDRNMKERAERLQVDIFSDLAEGKGQVDSMMAEYVKWYWRLSLRRCCSFRESWTCFRASEGPALGGPSLW